MKNTITVEVQNTVENCYVPAVETIQSWLNQAFPEMKEQSLLLRIVDEIEGTSLNKRWRNKAYATNILSFPYQAEYPHEDTGHLGDLVVTAQVVNNEAEKHTRQPNFHWAHMIIHGVLHLLGYDHEKDNEAQKMEALESELLNSIGYSDPYRYS